MATKLSQLGRIKSFRSAGCRVYQQFAIMVSVETHTICAESVRINVIRGETSGSTAKAVSPTRPRVTLLTASMLIGSFRYGATIKSQRWYKHGDIDALR